jgi:intracellular septation protein A
MYTVYVYKKIDIITTVSVAFVILFGWFSFKFHDPIFFKIQPAIFSAILSLVFFVTQMLNKPLLILLSQKYSNLLPEQIRQNLTHPMMRRLLKKLSHYLCYGLFFNTLLLTYAALFMNNTMWIVTKSFGLIFIMGVCGVLAKKELQRGV